MLQFKLLANIIGLQCHTTDDPDTPLIDLFNRTTSNANVYVLACGGGDVEYVIDIDLVVMNENVPSSIDTIGKLVTQFLTSEMVYSYQTNKFNFNRFVRNFAEGNILGEVKIGACNKNTGEVVDMIDDPSHPDIAIFHDELNMDKVLPLLDGRLYPCSWNDGKIYLEGESELLYTNPTIDFLSFADSTEVRVTKLDVLSDDGWELPVGFVPILVLAGRMFYGDSWVFKSGAVLELNPDIKHHPEFSEFIDMEELVRDNRSFVILVACRSIYMEETTAIHLDDKLYQFCTSYKEAKPINFICIGKENNAVHGITIVDEKYDDIKREDDPYTNYVYMRDPDSDVKLLQLTIA